MSTQPSQYAPIAEGIGAAGMQEAATIANDGGWRRIIIEKPFGHDLKSARELNNRLQKVFDETQIYRIDHYLGKETVQNILAFRFGNGIFEPLWNRRYIDHVQITAAESIGVEGRGAYYQEAGALRDMIQNHLLQVVATIAMEPSATFSSDAVRDERAKLLRSIHMMKPEEIAANAVAGQYGPGAWAGSWCRASARKKASVPIRRQKLTRPQLSWLKTGAGRPCRFTSERENTCPSGHRGRDSLPVRAARRLPQ